MEVYRHSIYYEQALFQILWYSSEQGRTRVWFSLSSHFQGVWWDKEKVVKNCKGLEMLPYLQANKLACYNFMTPGLEWKERLFFISVEVPDSHCFLVLVPRTLFSQGSLKRAGKHLHIRWVMLQERDLKLGEPTSFLMGSKHASPWLC